jgi:hypothetical protein
MNIPMNSKIGRFFYLLSSFILGAFFFLGGAYSLTLPWSSSLQNKTIDLILNHNLIFSLFGLGLILIGSSILTYAVLSSRRRYAYVRTGSHSVAVDKDLIQNYLETYWKEHFPDHSISSFITIKKNTIYIIADLPSVPAPEQKVFLDQVQHDFSDIFGRLLGYPHDVHLAASFRTEKSLI